MKKVFLFLLLCAVLLSGCVQQGNGNGGVSVQVEAGDTVRVEYRGTLEDGTEFDSSARQGQPLEFVAGSGQMIKGFDAAVIGMKQGQEKTVALRPSEAYGSLDVSKLVELPKSNFSEPEKLVEGLPVSSQGGPQGTIHEIRDETVVVNFNHPLAGKTLTFWIKVVGIEK